MCVHVLSYPLKQTLDLDNFSQMIRLIDGCLSATPRTPDSNIKKLQPLITPVYPGHTHHVCIKYSNLSLPGVYMSAYVQAYVPLSNSSSAGVAVVIISNVIFS